MKKLHLLSIILLLASTGCKKEQLNNSITLPPPPPPVFNIPPIVSAGANIQLVLPADSVILSGTVIAQGSKVKTYLWEKTNGPAAYKIEHPDSLITKVSGLQEGTYTFQLSITDTNGVTGKAAITVSVNSLTAFEYNLDLNIQAGYEIFNNTEICPWDCYYADQTIISTSVQLSSLNNIQVYVYEETDSAAQADKVNYGFTSFSITNELYASGNSSFTLKKIMQQGSGSFSGTIQLNSSSALRTPREDAFKALPPLIVTGKLDTLTKTVNMQIKGKIIF